MTVQLINIGSGPNQGNGDSLRVAFAKINQNFSTIFDNPTLQPGFLYTDGNGNLKWTTDKIVSLIQSDSPPLYGNASTLWYNTTNGRLHIQSRAMG